VVKDVAAAAKYLHEKLGIGPFAIVDFKDGHAEYQGRSVAYKSKVGLANYHGLAIELMQPYEGQTIQNDPAYLPAGGQGVHHLGFYVPDAEALAAEWEQNGAKVLQRSWPLPGALTIYLDTPEYAGVLVELIQLGSKKPAQG
jgi:catechol 2,3-dioxygenase-like lactoylglutathione lyase family enzyme